MGDQCSCRGIDHRNPEQEARHGDIGARKRERARQVPQQDRERHERGYVRDQLDGEVVDAVAIVRAVVAAVDEPVDILGDALIGVVGLAGDQADPVVVVGGEPARDEMIGEAAPPADHQHCLGEEFDHRHRDVGERPGREDEEELLPEDGAVARLDSVEPVAVEEAQPQQRADLGLVQQHEKHHHGGGDGPLAGGEAGGWPDARLRDLIGLEIAVGDAHDLPHGGPMCGGVDQDGEDRDRQRQRVGRQIGFVDRPQPGPAGQHRETGQDGLGGEDPDENLEEARDRGGTIRRVGAYERDDAEQRVPGVCLQCGLHQRQKAKECNGEAQCFHDVFRSGRRSPARHIG